MESKLAFRNKKTKKLMFSPASKDAFYDVQNFLQATFFENTNESKVQMILIAKAFRILSKTEIVEIEIKPVKKIDVSKAYKLLKNKP